MNKQLTFTILSMLVLVSAFNGSNVLAQYSSSNPSDYNLSVDKKIKWVEKNQTYDNIDQKTHVFTSNEQIEFTITVENTGKTVIPRIEVTDYLPKYLTLINFPGNYDKALQKVTWSIDNLNNGEKKEFSIRATVSDLTNSGVNWGYKQTNRVEVKSESTSDSDTASYFIGINGVKGKEVMPVTGDSSLPIKASIVGLTIVAAYLSRKAIRGY